MKTTVLGLDQYKAWASDPAVQEISEKCHKNIYTFMRNFKKRQNIIEQLDEGMKRSDSEFMNEALQYFLKFSLQAKEAGESRCAGLPRVHTFCNHDGKRVFLTNIAKASELSDSEYWQMLYLDARIAMLAHFGNNEAEFMNKMFRAAIDIGVHKRWQREKKRFRRSICRRWFRTGSIKRDMKPDSSK